MQHVRWGVSWLIGLWLLLTSAGALASAEIEFRAERHGNAVDIQAGALLQGDQSVIWRVLTDYGRYSQFIPGMASSEVVRRQGNNLVVEQRGEVNLLWVRRPMVATLSVVEDAPRSVESTLLSGTLKQMRGRYELTPREDGVQLTYVGRIVPHDEDVGLVDLLAIRGNTSRQFSALVREIERVVRHETSGTGK